MTYIHQSFNNCIRLNYKETLNLWNILFFCTSLLKWNLYQTGHQSKTSKSQNTKTHLNILRSLFMTPGLFAVQFNIAYINLALYNAKSMLTCRLSHLISPQSCEWKKDGLHRLLLTTRNGIPVLPSELPLWLIQSQDSYPHLPTLHTSFLQPYGACLFSANTVIL